MKITKHVILSIVFIMMVSGCSKAFWGGTAGGVLGAGAGYEYRANKELQRIENDYEEGLISQEEYEARKDQIQRMSVTK